MLSHLRTFLAVETFRNDSTFTVIVNIDKADQEQLGPVGVDPICFVYMKPNAVAQGTALE